jgi:hypothetical protein
MMSGTLMRGAVMRGAVMREAVRAAAAERSRRQSLGPRRFCRQQGTCWGCCWPGPLQGRTCSGWVAGRGVVRCGGMGGMGSPLVFVHVQAVAVPAFFCMMSSCLHSTRAWP